MRAVAAAILLVVLATGSVSAWSAGTGSGSASDRLGALINREHDRVCGQRLATDRRLAVAARYKAEDMGYLGYFGHVNKQGDHVWDGYAAAGIGWSLAAEIIGWNNAPAADSAQFVFDQFMESRPHRRAIRHCGYRSFGVGSFATIDRRLLAVEFVKP